MSEISFATRLWFAWACFFRVLFDGAFAGRAWAVRDRQLPAPSTSTPTPTLTPTRTPTSTPTAPVPPPTDAALQLLALFQREGRLVDFLEQDVASFPDADVGAAARVVHEGCRKALRAHAKIAPIRTEEEGTRVTVAAGFPPAEVKLSGNVAGSGPYTGVLRHRGWRAVELTLATRVDAHDGHDAHVLAPAEVEL
ncbi:MAG: DUF2760 domain-containing protein [Polyangiaceae bacterium]